MQSRRESRQKRDSKCLRIKFLFIDLLAFSNWIRRTGEDSRKFNNFYCFFLSLSRDVLHLAQSYRKRESGFGLDMESFILEVKIETVGDCTNTNVMKYPLNVLVGDFPQPSDCRRF